jgi:hypothetical protein
MKIVRSDWSKSHLVEAVKCLAENGQPSTQASEFGVYRGKSLSLIHNLFTETGLLLDKLLGFDSFEGLPTESDGVKRFELFVPGWFGDTNGLKPDDNEVVKYVKAWYSELSSKDIEKYGIEKQCLVHIDCDLYISTFQALDFLFANHLIPAGAVFAYDEFLHHDKPEDGGESLAHIQITEKYRVKFREFYRNIYKHNGKDMWQNCFVVEGVNVSDFGHGIEQEKHNG